MIDLCEGMELNLLESYMGCSDADSEVHSPVHCILCHSIIKVH